MLSVQWQLRGERQRLSVFQGQLVRLRHSVFPCVATSTPIMGGEKLMLTYITRDLVSCLWLIFISFSMLRREIYCVPSSLNHGFNRLERQFTVLVACALRLSFYINFLNRSDFFVYIMSCKCNENK